MVNRDRISKSVGILEVLGTTVAICNQGQGGSSFCYGNSRISSQTAPKNLEAVFIIVKEVSTLVRPNAHLKCGNCVSADF